MSGKDGDGVIAILHAGCRGFDAIGATVVRASCAPMLHIDDVARPFVQIEGLLHGLDLTATAAAAVELSRHLPASAVMAMIKTEPGEISLSYTVSELAGAGE